MRPLAPTRPPLRYHGGKWMLAPWIIQRFPPHRVYVEPFAGGASVLLRKPPAKAEVYNDLDGDVVNVFRVLRDPATAARLAGALRLTPYSRAEWFLAFEPSEDPVERARRTIARTYLSFGTTSRRSAQVGFRATPWRSEGSTAVADWVRYPEAVESFTRRLRGVLIEQRPALEVIDQQDRADVLFYVDPPYPIGARTAVRYEGDEDRAYAHNLTDEDHRALATRLRAAAGFVVVSGYRGALYEECYAGWPSVERRVRADGATERIEVLWLSPRTAAALDRDLFAGAAS